PVHLPELRNVHRPPRAFDDLLGRQPAFLPQAPELAKARLEDAGHALRRLLRRHFPIQRGQIAARPEAVLELVRAAHCLLQRPALLDDHHPGRDRENQKEQHHRLHDEGCLHDQSQYVQLVAHRSHSLSSLAGSRRGPPRSASMHATSAVARQISSPSSPARLISCANTTRAPRSIDTLAPTCNMSPSRAGAMNLASTEARTRKIP